MTSQLSSYSKKLFTSPKAIPYGAPQVAVHKIPGVAKDTFMDILFQVCIDTFAANQWPTPKRTFAEELVVGDLLGCKKVRSASDILIYPGFEELAH